MTDKNLINIRYLFNHYSEYMQQAAAVMLADRLLPGINEHMEDVSISRPKVVHSLKIFLALERENA